MASRTRTIMVPSAAGTVTGSLGWWAMGPIGAAVGGFVGALIPLIPVLLTYRAARTLGADVLSSGGHFSAHCSALTIDVDGATAPPTVVDGADNDRDEDAP